MCSAPDGYWESRNPPRFKQSLKDVEEYKNPPKGYTFIPTEVYDNSYGKATVNQLKPIGLKSTDYLSAIKEVSNLGGIYATGTIVYPGYPGF